MQMKTCDYAFKFKEKKFSFDFKVKIGQSVTKKSDRMRKKCLVIRNSKFKCYLLGIETYLPTSSYQWQTKATEEGEHKQWARTRKRSEHFERRWIILMGKNKSLNFAFANRTSNQADFI